MRMAAEAQLSAHLEDSLRKLRAAWPTRGWSWDGRFDCLASSFHAELAQRARDAAQLALPHQWGHGNLSSAPAVLRDLASRSGGLRAGQALFASAPIGRGHAYGLWWPWVDNVSISLRIGLAGPDFAERHYERLRDLFGVTL
jgi:hypothetical protein